VIHNLSTSRKVIWPPNHKMKDVSVNYTATDNCPGPINCVLTVTSNEPQIGNGNGNGNGHANGNGNGNGHNSSDWTVTDDHHISLRAERNGGGRGRTYTIAVACTDQHNNTDRDTATVLVPHDLRSGFIRQLVLHDLKQGI